MTVAILEPPQFTVAAESPRIIFAGVDTHKDTHYVAIVDDHGQPIADREFLAVGSGYRKIIEFLHAYGIVDAVGVEEIPAPTRWNLPVPRLRPLRRPL
ncbi:IS110 family transposase [Cryobacterium sp. Hh38]|uniref:IS110 family transposase n=1 Tax=Cryobacterium sp. Hh38 TaxID=1259156 RepID=UPI00141B131E|nr:IS110 family transposase [Cryobacterium sp. Hh38]